MLRKGSRPLKRKNGQNNFAEQQPRAVGYASAVAYALSGTSRGCKLRPSRSLRILIAEFWPFRV